MLRSATKSSAGSSEVFFQRSQSSKMSIGKILFNAFVASLLLVLGTKPLVSFQKDRQRHEVGTTPERPDATELLKKVSERYRDLKSYHFQIHLLTEIQSESMWKSLETDLDVSISGPARSRIVMSGALGELQSFSDGSTHLDFPSRTQAISTPYRPRSDGEPRAAHGSRLISGWRGYWDCQSVWKAFRAGAVSESPAEGIFRGGR